MSDENPRSVFHDRTRDRYMVVLSNGDYLNWDNPHWQAIMWIVCGRTDTNWEVMPYPYVCFFHKEDADAAVRGIRKHQQFLRALALLCVKDRENPNAA